MNRCRACGWNFKDDSPQCPSCGAPQAAGIKFNVDATVKVVAAKVEKKKTAAPKKTTAKKEAKK